MQYQLTDRLAAEADTFADSLANTPDDLLMSIFESPPPRASLPLRWVDDQTHTDNL